MSDDITSGTLLPDPASQVENYLPPGAHSPICRVDRYAETEDYWGDEFSPVLVWCIVRGTSYSAKNAAAELKLWILKLNSTEECHLSIQIA